MKTCCNKECKQNNPQPFSSFNKDAHMKDKLKSKCKECMRVYRKEIYSFDPERQYIYNLKYITLHPERRAYTQKRYSINRKKLNEQKQER